MCQAIQKTYHHYKNTGAICPSSPQLVDTIIKAADLASKKHIVELGPGTGVITEAIIMQKPADTTYFGLDINPTFIDTITQKIQGVRIYNDSAESIEKHLLANNIEKADCIISSLPWANFSVDYQEKLLSTLYNALSKNGIFITYAYNLGLYFAKGRKFRALLYKKFDTVEKSNTIWKNIPPAFIYTAQK